MVPFTKIAERIKQFRALRKKTQVSLASEASIDYRHFQKLEAGQSDFKVSTIFKLSDALDIPACYLLQSDPLEAVDESCCPTGVLGQLRMGLVAFKWDGQLCFCNPQFCTILGYENDVSARKELNLSGFFSSGESSNGTNEYFARVRNGDLDADFIRLKTKSQNLSEARNIFVYWNRVLDKNQNPKGVVASVWEHKSNDQGVLPGRVANHG